jgi:ribosomal protein S18 acetylase RimI-like enzyme
MNITTATPNDVSQLTKLINVAYRGDGSHQGWTSEEDILGGIRIDEPTLSHLLTQENIKVLKCTDQADDILGTVCLELKSSELYLGMFAVSPAAQGLGIGKALMAAAVQFALANHCKQITITVISTRTALIQWYERQNYRPTGKFIKFDDLESKFGDPKVEDIQLMEMSLSLSSASRATTD